VKLNIYTIETVKKCDRNECNIMKAGPEWHEHSSSGANRSSDFGVTVNINAEFDLRATNPIMEWFSRDFVTECC